MSEKNTNTPEQEQDIELNAAEGTNEATKQAAEENQAEMSDADKLAAAEEEIAQWKDKYIRQVAEFDNYRKRTVKEKAELIKNGGEKAMLGLLPVIDDFERAIDAIDKSSDVEGLKEGVDLIYNKFMKYLESQQVKPMESTGTDFDADIYEAVTTFPAPDESMKGKVIDTVQKGYTINEKVLRHAKVVVGQ